MTTEYIKTIVLEKATPFTPYNMQALEAFSNSIIIEECNYNALSKLSQLSALIHRMDYMFDQEPELQKCMPNLYTAILKEIS